MERIFNITIDNESNGKIIKNILMYNLGISRNLMISLKKRENGIMLNHEHATVNTIVNEGDFLTLLIEDKNNCSENIVATPGKLDIVYEDADILIINKPPNLPVHPSKGHFDDSLANIVTWYYKQKSENFTFRCVNRLDSGTSGIMAIAKNAYSHCRLSLQIQNDKLRREYIAIVCGNVEDNSGTVDMPIRRIPGIPTIMREVSNEGKRAVTHYKVLRRTGQYTVLRLRLETGRTHQIRVHMSYIGHPLVGDFLYGTENNSIITRHALHSERIYLRHPVTGKPLSFAVPMPQDMISLIR